MIDKLSGVHLWTVWCQSIRKWLQKTGSHVHTFSGIWDRVSEFPKCTIWGMDEQHRITQLSSYLDKILCRPAGRGSIGCQQFKESVTYPTKLWIVWLKNTGFLGKMLDKISWCAECTIIGLANYLIRSVSYDITAY